MQFKIFVTVIIFNLTYFEMNRINDEKYLFLVEYIFVMDC